MKTASANLKLKRPAGKNKGIGGSTGRLKRTTKLQYAAITLCFNVFIIRSLINA